MRRSNLTTDVKKPSKDWNGEQDTISSTSSGSCLGSCGERSRRLNQCPRSGGWNPQNGRLKQAGRDCSPFLPSNSYLTLGSRPADQAPAPASWGPGFECKSRFPLSSQVERTRARTVAPLQILIFTSFYADVRFCILRFPVRFGFHLYKNLYRLCLTSGDRAPALNFFRFHDRSLRVRQNNNTNDCNHQPSQPCLVRRKRGSQGCGDRVPAFVRRALCAASLVYPNNCPKNRKGKTDAELLACCH